MGTKVKNILKGLRYISQIFDEKEEEIQIGFPTDVKHVAHIGWDGPSANTPTWMNEFRSPSEVASGPLESIGTISSKGIQDTMNRNKIPKSRRHHTTNLGSPVGSPVGSPAKRSSDGSKHSRRSRSKDGSMGSPTRDSSGSSCHSSGSSRHSRWQQKSNLGPESSNQDQPNIPKSSRRKKGGSTEGGSIKSTRSSRSKGQDSLTDNQFSDLGAMSEFGKKEVTEDKRIAV